MVSTAHKNSTVITDLFTSYSALIHSTDQLNFLCYITVNNIVNKHPVLNYKCDYQIYL